MNSCISLVTQQTETSLKSLFQWNKHKTHCKLVITYRLAQYNERNSFNCDSFCSIIVPLGKRARLIDTFSISVFFHSSLTLARVNSSSFTDCMVDCIESGQTEAPPGCGACIAESLWPNTVIRKPCTAHRVAQNEDFDSQSHLDKLCS